MKEGSAKFSKALIEFIPNLDELNEVKKELIQFKEILNKEAKLMLFFKVPHIAKQDKIKLLELICYEFQFHKELRDFLKIVILKNRIELLDDVILELNQYYEKQKGIMKVRLELPFEIDDSGIENLRNEFCKKFDKEINLNVFLNRKLVFGFRIFFDFTLLDLSLNSVLGKLREAIIKE
jgi:ATP synthase F1 delta subunit